MLRKRYIKLVPGDSSALYQKGYTLSLGNVVDLYQAGNVSV